MTANDPTDSKGVRAPDQLETAAILAKMAANDINNLMGIVLGNAEALRGVVQGNADAEERLARVEHAAEKTSHLARRFLSVVEGRAEKAEVINLNPVVAHVLDSEKLDHAPNIRIKRYLDPDLWNVAANTSSITQVIQTLSRSAFEALGDDGLISLSTQNVELDEASARSLRGLEPGPHVLVTVEGTSEGIDPRDFGRLFDPVAARVEEGAGTGLSVVYRTVKDHRGHIAVRGEPGIGAAFDVYLPATAAPVGVKASIEGESAIGYETVLAVDDEELMLDVVRAVLTGAGYHVLTARNGKEALEIAEHHGGPIHLTLLDLMMPGMGGAETYPLLKKARPEMNIIIMSGYDLGTLDQSLRKLGVDGLLQKPFRRETLIEAVRQGIDGPVSSSA